MIAVLFNQADVRLGEVQMPDACWLIAFGGGMFVRTDTEAMLDRGGKGIAFQAMDRYVISELDRYNPRRTAHAQPARRPAAKAVQGRPAPDAEVGHPQPARSAR